MEKPQQQFSLWYFVIAFVLLMLLQSLFTASHVQLLDYSEFKALLRAGNISVRCMPSLLEEFYLW